MNASTIYTAAMRAGSRDELDEIIVAVDVLQAAGAIPADDDFFRMRAQLSRLYWNSYYRRVMVDAAAD